MESPIPQSGSRSATLTEGFKDSLPIVISYIPVAFAFGLNATRLGFTPVESVFFSCIIYAGASQFVITTMLAAGSSLWVAALTVMGYPPCFIRSLPAQSHHTAPEQTQKRAVGLWPHR